MKRQSISVFIKEIIVTKTLILTDIIVRTMHIFNDDLQIRRQLSPQECFSDDL